MAFNVLAHNRDDHVKSLAFLLDDTTGDWAFSPAYDLVFTPGPGGEHSMTVAGEGRAPDRSHMLELARRSDVPRREAEAIIDEVRAAVAGWPAVGRDRREVGRPLAGQAPGGKARRVAVEEAVDRLKENSRCGAA